LTQSQIDPPVTADRSERRAVSRKRRFPRALLLAPVILAAVGVVLIVVLGGGKSGGIIHTIIGGGEDDTVPPFEFRVAKTSAVATAADADKDALKSQATSVAGDVEPVLDALYTNAFLDPANWRHDDYESVVALFADDAASSAQQDLATLTLGANAGDTYDTVTPTRGSLEFKVLFDPDGNPDTVVATVKFTALGAGTDGTYTAIVSSGQYFLRNLDGWKVTAYEVKRADHPTHAPSPSPGPSGSPSASGSG
jgi:hypothetical protein